MRQDIKQTVPLVAIFLTLFAWVVFAFSACPARAQGTQPQIISEDLEIVAGKIPNDLRSITGKKAKDAGPQPTGVIVVVWKPDVRIKTAKATKTCEFVIEPTQRFKDVVTYRVIGGKWLVIKQLHNDKYLESWINLYFVLQFGFTGPHDSLIWK